MELKSQGLEESNNDLRLCEQEALGFKNDIEMCQKQAELRTHEYSCNQFGKSSVHPTGDVVISLIRHVEDAREIDACIGMSTNLGYITFNQCCTADNVTLFDLKTYEEVSIEPNSTWIEENICFINTTEIQKMIFPDFHNDDIQTCSVLVFDESKGEFTQHQLEIEIGKCFEKPCPVDPNLSQSKTILNGTSVVCDRSSQFGIITSQLYLHLCFCLQNF